MNNGPPKINSLSQNGDGSVTVSGAGLTPDSRIFFDGLQATPTVPFAASDSNNASITVTPPQGASGQTATVMAYTADNQNSMIVQQANPVTYSYPAAGSPQITTITPQSLPAGYNSMPILTAMVTITTTPSANLVDGQVSVLASAPTTSPCGASGCWTPCT